MNRLVSTFASLVVFGSIAGAGEIVEVRLLEEKQATQVPATQPSADATMLLAIEALIDPSGNFHASCLVGDKTIRLDGNMKTMSDGARQVKIDFLNQEDFHPAARSTESITSHIVMHPGAECVIGGMHSRSAGQRFIVATIKPDAGPTTRKAQ